MKSYLQKHIGTAVRHALAWAGAVLASKGVATEEAVNSLAGGLTEIVTGVIIMLGSLAWSYWHNRKLKAGTEA
jgi:hypothetical protein